MNLALAHALLNLYLLQKDFMSAFCKFYLALASSAQCVRMDLIELECLVDELASTPDGEAKNCSHMKIEMDRHRR